MNPVIGCLDAGKLEQKYGSPIRMAVLIRSSDWIICARLVLVVVSICGVPVQSIDRGKRGRQGNFMLFTI